MGCHWEVVVGEMNVGVGGLGWPMDVWGGVWGGLWGEVGGDVGSGGSLWGEWGGDVGLNGAGGFAGGWGHWDIIGRGWLGR